MRRGLLFLLAVLGCNLVDVDDGRSAPNAGAVPIAMPDLPPAHASVAVVVNPTEDASSPATSLALEPPAITIPAGRNQIFVAKPSATSWHVTEDDGGAIDDGGHYVAPSTPGTYHVVASDGASTGTAVVNVIRTDVSILTGDLGGFGNIDGLGPAARLSLPGGIVHDEANGALYVADPPIVRKVDIATGMVTTFSGGTDAALNYPWGVAYRAATKTLYVSDSGDHTVRAIDVSTGVVSTIAGTHRVVGSADGVGTNATFKAPSGLCLIGSTLYVSDSESSVIRTVDLDTKEVRLLAGQTDVFGYQDSPDPRKAAFNRVYGIACGPSTVYVADFNSHVIRTIDQSGTATDGNVATIAGIRTNGPIQDGDALTEARFGGVHSITFDKAHSMLYVGEWGRKSIRAIDLAQSKVSTRGSASTLGQPNALATNGATVWISDETNSEVRALDIASSTFTTLAGKGGASGAGDDDGPIATAKLRDPSVLALGSDTLYVGAPSKVRAISFSSGKVSSLGAPLKGVAALAMGPTGEVWVADPSRFLGPHGAAWASGQFYVTDSSDRIRAVDATTDVLTTLSAPVLPYQALGLASNGTDKLWVTERAGILEIDLVTHTITPLAGDVGAVGANDGIGTEARFNTPWGLFYDGRGSLWVADSVASTVRRIWLATRAVSTVAGQPYRVGVRLGSVQTATINHPRGLVVTDGGTVLVTSEQAVLRIGAF